MRGMRPARLLTLVALALALATAATSTAAVPRSGLHGTVMRGPTTPVCRVDVPCEAPARNVVLTFWRGGVGRTTRTDGSGAYRIGLPPGIYSVRTGAKPLGLTPYPARVHVRAGHSDKIVFMIDTGIR
jgi:hypothetical protein